MGAKDVRRFVFAGAHTGAPYKPKTARTQVGDPPDRPYKN